ncbi:leucine-rich repeat flightless-interacting protein 1 isoform X15 [Delphinus delphis]|uniref:leucine-rich repeat flightless-interacting protein 1 isoform X15 n=1 Tax=Delphinus delphis TaxID=9728 RepID=UPI0028C48626|nr:leucine-rich repeat flightless-interacting protein 1 isoform X16 [Delphinus delphis]
MTNPAAAQNQEIDCLSPEAQRLAEARLAAKRAARAEAREIRMKELERQQKEIYQVQKKYYGLDTKWGDIEQWMEDSERYSRRSRRNTSASDEDDRVSAGSRGSLRVEERPEKDFTEKGSRGLPGLSAATLASLGGTSSRRGSGDTSISIDTEASIREIKELNELKDQIQDVEGKYMQGLKEMKDSLAEVEEKYKKAMVSNAQLDNEKTNFMYQVDTLKDMMLELEEQLAESRRQYEEKTKEFEREKHAHSILQFQFAEVKEALKQREEMLEKHGIILNSEVATNGETSDPLNNVGYQGSTKMTKEELNALKATGDGTLGRANEVEVKDEMVENEGKREILQNTEQRQHKEDPGEDCVDTEVLHPGDNAEDQRASEDSAPSPGTLVNSGNEEQVQSQILENTSFFESTQQVESSEVINSELDGEIPGPGIGQRGSNALDTKNQSKESAEEWEKEKQEDFETNMEEISVGPRQECAPLQISEVGRESSADTGEQSGNPTEAVPEAEPTGLGEQVGTVASSPPRGIDDTVSHREKCEVDAPEGLDPSSGHDSEKELTSQEVAEPKEVPIQSTEVGGENNEGEGNGRKLRDEKPIKLEVQAIPCSPEARSSPQEVTGPSTVDAESESLDVKEPDEEKNDQQGEAPDSSPKKTKNKKKKNKKKKSPAPVETKEVQKELTFQNPDLSEVNEEQVELTDKKPVVDAQNEVTKNPKQDAAAGSSENADGPENPKTELDGGLQQDDYGVNTKTRKAVADGDTLDFEDNTVQSSGTSASNKELEEGARKDDAEEDGTAPSRPPGPDNEEVPGSALLQHEGPSKDINDACRTKGTGEHVTSENRGHTVRKVSDSVSLENDDVAPAGEVGDFNSESKEEMTGGHGKGRNKEDCALS